MKEIEFRFYYKNRCIETLTLEQIADKCKFHWAPDVVVCQYTGLKDKEGVKIFEGDIVEFDAHEWGDTQDNKWLVEWNDKDGEWSTGGGTNRECAEWKTVIGNIHEHPELLDEK